MLLVLANYVNGDDTEKYISHAAERIDEVWDVSGSSVPSVQMENVKDGLENGTRDGVGIDWRRFFGWR